VKLKIFMAAINEQAGWKSTVPLHNMGSGAAAPSSSTQARATRITSRGGSISLKVIQKVNIAPGFVPYSSVLWTHHAL
jgi:hypothetical protein